MSLNVQMLRTYNGKIMLEDVEITSMEEYIRLVENSPDRIIFSSQMDLPETPLKGKTKKLHEAIYQRVNDPQIDQQVRLLKRKMRNRSK